MSHNWYALFIWKSPPTYPYSQRYVEEFFMQTCQRNQQYCILWWVVKRCWCSGLEISLHNGSACVPMGLYTGVDNIVSKLSIINVSEKSSRPNSLLIFYWSTNASSPFLRIIYRIESYPFINLNPFIDIYLFPFCYCPALTSKYPFQGRWSWQTKETFQYILELIVLHCGQFQYIHHGGCFE